MDFSSFPYGGDADPQLAGANLYGGGIYGFFGDISLEATIDRSVWADGYAIGDFMGRDCVKFAVDGRCLSFREHGLFFKLTVSTIPEPGAAALACFGLLALLIGTRSRTRRRPLS
jgi:hypothetical protein